MPSSPTGLLPNGKHILFYDGDCPLCNRAVRFVLTEDRRKEFLFAPLGGKTAEVMLKDLRLKHPDLDTLVLLEKAVTDHQKIWVEGRGAMRILWLLGGWHRTLGWFCFLPGFLFDFGYRFIAKRRYQLFTAGPFIVKDDRFLP